MGYNNTLIASSLAMVLSSNVLFANNTDNCNSSSGICFKKGDQTTKVTGVEIKTENNQHSILINSTDYPEYNIVFTDNTEDQKVETNNILLGKDVSSVIFLNKDKALNVSYRAITPSLHDPKTFGGLVFDFGLSKSQSNKTADLKFEGTSDRNVTSTLNGSTANINKYSLQGDIVAKSGFGKNNLNATFNGDMIGNIITETQGKDYKDFISLNTKFEFQENANLDGSIRSGVGNNVFIFNNGGITGNVIAHGCVGGGDNIYTPGCNAYFDGGMNTLNLVTFKKDGFINGDIIAYAGASDDTKDGDSKHNAYNIIVFQENGKIGTESNKSNILASPSGQPSDDIVKNGWVWGYTNAINLIKFTKKADVNLDSMKTLYFSANAHNMISLDGNESGTQVKIDSINTQSGGKNYIGKNLFEITDGSLKISEINQLDIAKGTLKVGNISGYNGVTLINIENIEIEKGINSNVSKTYITTNTESTQTNKINGEISLRGGGHTYNHIYLNGNGKNYLGEGSTTLGTNQNSDKSLVLKTNWFSYRNHENLIYLKGSENKAYLSLQADHLGTNILSFESEKNEVYITKTNDKGTNYVGKGLLNSSTQKAYDMEKALPSIKDFMSDTHAFKGKLVVSNGLGIQGNSKPFNNISFKADSTQNGETIFSKGTSANAIYGRGNIYLNIKDGNFSTSGSNKYVIDGDIKSLGTTINLLITGVDSNIKILNGSIEARDNGVNNILISRSSESGISTASDSSSANIDGKIFAWYGFNNIEVKTKDFTMNKVGNNGNIIEAGNYGKNEIKFNNTDTLTLNGNINAYNNSQNIIKINSKTNSIKGGLFTRGGSNTVTFNGGSSNKIGESGFGVNGNGSGVANFGGNLAVYVNGGTNTIAFNQNGSTNQTNEITKVVRADGGTNTIVFNSTNGTTFTVPTTNASTNSIKSGLFARGGTNIVTFNGGTNNTIGESGFEVANNAISSATGQWAINSNSGSNIINLKSQGTKLEVAKKIRHGWTARKTEFNLMDNSNELTIKGDIVIGGSNLANVNGVIFNFNGDNGKIKLQENGSTTKQIALGENTSDYKAKLTVNFTGNHSELTANILTQSGNQDTEATKNITTINLANGKNATIDGTIKNARISGATADGARTVFNFLAPTAETRNANTTSTLTLKGEVENKSGEMIFNFNSDNSVFITTKGIKTSGKNSSTNLNVGKEGLTGINATLKGSLTTEAEGTTAINFNSDNSSFKLIDGTQASVARTGSSASTNGDTPTEIKHTAGNFNLNFDSLEGTFRNRLTVGAAQANAGSQAQASSTASPSTSAPTPSPSAAATPNTAKATITVKEGKSGILVGAIQTSSGASTTVQLGHGSKLTFQGDKNTITTLGRTSGALNFDNSIIDLASGSYPNTTRAEGHNFRVLEIGNKTSSGGTGVATRSGENSTGLIAENLTFQVFADKNATNAKIGGEDTNNNGSNSYGYAYSDRLIVHSVGGTTPLNENLIVVIDPSQVTNIVHVQGKGTEEKDNIAVATVKNGDNNQALVNLNPQAIENGGEILEVQLKTEQTDEKGKVTNGDAKTNNANGYTTYFLGKAISRGATETVQKAVSSALAINYDLYIANFNSLNKRMGELRGNPKNQGVWTRIFGGAQHSNFGLGNKTQYLTVQGGYDYDFALKGAKNYLGLALSYASSNGKSLQAQAGSNGRVVDGQGSVSLTSIRSNAYEVALYNAYVSDVGIYNDTIAKFSYINSNFKLSNSIEGSAIGNFGLTLSNEVGYRYVFAENVFIDPQIELGLGYIDQSEFIAKLKSTGGFNTLNASQHAILMLRSRIGASIGKRVSDNKQAASIYLGTFYEYDAITGGDNQILLGGGSNTPNASLGSSGRVIINIGGNVELNENARLYMDMEKSFGDKLRTHLQFNVGTRYSF